MEDKNKEKKDAEEQKKYNGPVEFEKNKESQEAEEMFDKFVLS